MLRSEAVNEKWDSESDSISACKARFSRKIMELAEFRMWDLGPDRQITNQQSYSFAYSLPPLITYQPHRDPSVERNAG